MWQQWSAAQPVIPTAAGQSFVPSLGVLGTVGWPATQPVSYAAWPQAWPAAGVPVPVGSSQQAVQTPQADAANPQPAAQNSVAPAATPAPVAPAAQDGVAQGTGEQDSERMEQLKNQAQAWQQAQQQAWMAWSQQWAGWTSAYEAAAGQQTAQGADKAQMAAAAAAAAAVATQVSRSLLRNSTLRPHDLLLRVSFQRKTEADTFHGPL